MSASRSLGGRRGLYTAVAATAVLLVMGAVALVLAFRGSGGPPQPTAADAVPVTSRTAPTTSATPGGSAPVSRPGATASAAPDARVGAFLPASDPVGIDIPSIGLHSRGIVGLHVGADGTLQAPTSFERVGWYTGGPTPGQLGPAVLGGHVDSRSGPAVFYRLGELHRGAEVTVTRRDGSVARFVIDRVGRFAKAAFPTREVYGNTTNRAEIRLITCGGAFDRATGHYVDNIVAFGHLSA